MEEITHFTRRSGQYSRVLDIKVPMLDIRWANASSKLYHLDDSHHSDSSGGEACLARNQTRCLTLAYRIWPQQFQKSPKGCAVRGNDQNGTVLDPKLEKSVKAFMYNRNTK